MAMWFRSFYSDFCIKTRSWEKSSRSKLLRNFWTSKFNVFRSFCVQKCWIPKKKTKNSILTNKTKSWEHNLRNGRMCNAWIMLWRKKYVINVLIESKTRCHQCILEANRSFGEKCLNVMWQWGNWKQKLVSPMYFCVCVVSSGRAPRVGEGGSPPGLDEHRRFFMTRGSSGWVLMLLNFFWSTGMVSEL